MRAHQRGARLGLGLTMIACSGLAACDTLLGHELNPTYCRAHPSDATCRLAFPDAGVDGPMHCTSSADCASPTAVCDVGGTMTCVQCTPSDVAACTGDMPACVDFTCQGCTTHAQCTASQACLPDGSCADPAQVAYVRADGAGTECTQAMPCATLGAAVSANRPIIKFATGTVADNKATMIQDRTITILAEAGATLARSNNGTIVEARDNTDLEIYDLEVSGGTGMSAPAISVPNGTTKLALIRAKVRANQGLGISFAGSALTIAQSTIANNNAGGMQLTAGTFAIVGNIFVNNGTGTSNIGGLSISTLLNVANRLELNTFAKNATTDGLPSALNCVAGTGFTARNNIMSNNGTLTQMEQVGGTCLYTYSIIRPGTLPPGTGNSAADPLFVNASMNDLHLQPTSPARRAADPATDLTGLAARDIDGQARVAPADIGADQLP